MPFFAFSIAFAFQKELKIHLHDIRKRDGNKSTFVRAKERHRERKRDDRRAKRAARKEAKSNAFIDDEAEEAGHEGSSSRTSNESPHSSDEELEDSFIVPRANTPPTSGTEFSGDGLTDPEDDEEAKTIGNKANETMRRVSRSLASSERRRRIKYGGDKYKPEDVRKMVDGDTAALWQHIDQVGDGNTLQCDSLKTFIDGIFFCSSTPCR